MHWEISGQIKTANQRFSPRALIAHLGFLTVLPLTTACAPFTPAQPKMQSLQSAIGSTFPLTTPTPSQAEPSPTPLTTPTTGSFTLSELTPFNTRFFSTSTAALPQGATYDAKTQVLYWIPQKGQSGSYQIPTGPSGETVTFEVAAAKNLEQGPPTKYKDGEIGFVYVHGLSSENYCINQGSLVNYWGTTPFVLSPDSSLRTLACYDGTRAVEESAVFVAQQIAGASCGPYKKCVVVAHSMGNLIMEYILTHTRAPEGSDPEPQLFAQRALFKQVKDKTLFVVSLASAAGGSKIANILNDPAQANVVQTVVGALAGLLGQSTPATRSLTVERASTILAPINADPGVPFFMVGGYTTQTAGELGLLNTILGDVPQTAYNGDSRYTQLDQVALFNSRADGMVDFRSACGLASANVNEGPGYGAQLAYHFNYCLHSPKKANHYLWFISNLNHSLIAAPWWGCFNSSNPCVSWFPDASGSTLVYDGTTFAKSTIDVIRSRLF